MHHAQISSNPVILLNLSIFDRKDIDSRLIKYGKALNFLLEGDASNIDEQLQNKYYSSAKKRFPLGTKIFCKKIPDEYKLGKKIIREKFGNDREKINKLYWEKPGKLVEIFGLNK